MRIDRIQLRTIRLRLRAPFRTSSGVTHDRTILLVRLEGEGVEGVGECVAGETPSYSPETVETARWVLERHLAPALLGVRFERAAELVPVLEQAARGHRMAKASLEMAAWDAEARSRGQSLASLLGGARSAVPAGVSLGISEDRGALLERIGAHLAEGYRRIKLKISPGRDLEVVTAVRERYPEIPLTVDANGAYGIGDADHLARLDEAELLYLEQPFPGEALLEHAALQRVMRTPICLDESVTSAARCRQALALGAVGVVNIKPGRVGGHASSKAIHDICQAAGIPVWCGGMLESGVGRAHNVALASLPNMTLPGDVSASDRYWERDIVIPPFTLEPDGTVAVPDGPGIGVTLDEAFVRRIEVDRLELR